MSSRFLVRSRLASSWARRSWMSFSSACLAMSASLSWASERRPSLILACRSLSSLAFARRSFSLVSWSFLRSAIAFLPAADERRIFSVSITAMRSGPAGAGAAGGRARGGGGGGGGPGRPGGRGGGGRLRRGGRGGQGKPEKPGRGGAGQNVAGGKRHGLFLLLDFFLTVRDPLEAGPDAELEAFEAVLRQGAEVLRVDEPQRRPEHRQQDP